YRPLMSRSYVCRTTAQWSRPESPSPIYSFRLLPLSSSRTLKSSQEPSERQKRYFVALLLGPIRSTAQIGRSSLAGSSKPAIIRCGECSVIVGSPSPRPLSSATVDVYATPYRSIPRHNGRCRSSIRFACHTAHVGAFSPASLAYDGT